MIKTVLCSIALSTVLIFPASYEVKDTHINKEYTSICEKNSACETYQSHSTRAIACGNCEGGRLIETTSYSEWRRTGKTQNCAHMKPYGQDLEIYRSVEVTFECNKCKASYSEVSYEYDWECHGSYY